VETKKQLEILLLNYFRECYNDFPKGRIVPSESPDFIVRSKLRKNIGIELTRLHPVMPISSLTDSDNSALKYELIEEVRELFERSSGLKLFVKILFSEKKKIGMERQLSVAALLANQVRKAVGHKNKSSYFHHTINSKELPEGLETVLLVHHPAMRESFWEEVNDTGVSDNVFNDLHRIIQNKDGKMYLYRKQHLNEYWLVITTDCLMNTKHSNVANHIFKADFHSEFNRVLLFDLIKSKVFEIK